MQGRGSGRTFGEGLELRFYSHLAVTRCGVRVAPFPVAGKLPCELVGPRFMEKATAVAFAVAFAITPVGRSCGSHREQATVPPAPRNALLVGEESASQFFYCPRRLLRFFCNSVVLLAE